jgi:hypothetical protein
MDTISTILSLQEALLATIRRVEGAKESFKKLKEENELMTEYINNLMAATGTSSIKK